MNIQDIYQKTILEYSRDKSNNFDLKQANYIERGHNPSCGDDISIMIYEKNKVIEDISFIGQGCAISTASTNILIGLVKGKKIDDIKELIKVFFEMIRTGDLTEQMQNILEDASILQFTYNMPARVKCATLSWHSLNILLDKVV